LTNKIQNNLTDQHLVKQVLDGDTSAFGTIIKKTEGLVAQIVFKMINNSEDRKDIAQDIYLKTFKKLSGFKFQSKLSTWIGQIAYNTCLNYLEKKKLIILPKTESEGEALSSETTNTSNNETENLIFQKDLSEILISEIDILPPLYKTLITLYHNEELSYEEIAQITELPEGTVKSYLFRARKSLRESLLRKYKKEEL